MKSLVTGVTILFRDFLQILKTLPRPHGTLQEQGRLCGGNKSEKHW